MTTVCGTASERPCVLVGYDGPIVIDWQANLQPDQFVTGVTAVEVGTSDLTLTAPGPTMADYVDEYGTIPAGKGAQVNVSGGNAGVVYTLQFKITAIGSFPSDIFFDVLLRMA